MPLVRYSTYSPPPLFRNPHVQTVHPALFRRVSGVDFQRERISTPDGDFLDLDWSSKGFSRLGILCHGLEGSSTRPYMKGMARALDRHGWDALAWSYRGCSGEPNGKPRFYHSGATEDLETVVRHALSTGRYGKVALIGFSLGGNLVLKYLGDAGEALPSEIQAAVAFSVPCDLASGAREMAKARNRLYMDRFLKMLREKIRAKMELFPGSLHDEGFERIRDFKQFDDRYTAPLHGFRSAEDYWRKASCRRVLPAVRVPALLVNAQDDPFLGEACYPRVEAEESDRLFLEIPQHGGHAGFVAFGDGGLYWSERRAMAFLAETLGE